MNYKEDLNELVDLISNSSMDDNEKVDILFAMRAIEHRLIVLTENSTTTINELKAECDNFFSKENLHKIISFKN